MKKSRVTSPERRRPGESRERREDYIGSANYIIARSNYIRRANYIGSADREQTMFLSGDERAAGRDSESGGGEHPRGDVRGRRGFSYDRGRWGTLGDVRGR
eukprot:1196288-Prorocentrum_minimum.AAC.6